MKKLPWYARLASAGGRPAVLFAAIALSAPGEYQLARMSGWSPWVAWLMPLVISVYAASAAALAASRPKGKRSSAVAGSGFALLLALAAQVVAHLLSNGYMHKTWWLVAVTSAIPPVVVAHVLHLASQGGEKAEKASEQHVSTSVSLETPVSNTDEKGETAPEQHVSEAVSSETPVSNTDEKGETTLEQHVPTDISSETEHEPHFSESFPLKEESASFLLEPEEDEELAPSSDPYVLGSFSPETPVSTPTEKAETTLEQHVSTAVSPETRSLLTSAEVAARYGKSLSTIGTWKHRGRIVPVLVDPTLGNLYDPETLPRF